MLSDGPDPSADPVGYAEAQVLPLRQIRASQQPLQHAIARLASAYQQFEGTDGASRTRPALTSAVKTINALCPGATQ